MSGASRRIAYAGSVHDQREIDAVVEVLRGGATALRIGKNVRAFEARVAALFGKQRGVMCNSGSSALYLAVELLGLAPGDEVLTTALTFSTDVAPLVRAGLVPVFVDVEPDSYNLDVAQLESALGARTRAILAPNLIGNAPDWDAIRSVADRHALRVVEDSCDALGAKLRGIPTGKRSDVSVTSFALSHIITAAGTGGMVCLDDEALADRCLLLRRWGRRSEPQLFGSRKGEKRFFSSIGELAQGSSAPPGPPGQIPRSEAKPSEGFEYDNLFIFDEVGWNFEPSELGAAFGLVQLDKLAVFLETRRRNFARLQGRLARHPEVFALPRTLAGLETGWHMFPVRIRAESGVRRAALQAFLAERGIDSRMVWTGNVLRQPAFRAIRHRVAPGGLANTDRVMEQGLVLPCHHGMGDADVDWIGDAVDAWLRDPA